MLSGVCKLRLNMSKTYAVSSTLGIHLVWISPNETPPLERVPTKGGVVGAALRPGWRRRACVKPVRLYSRASSRIWAASCSLFLGQQGWGHSPERSRRTVTLNVRALDGEVRVSSPKQASPISWGQPYREPWLVLQYLAVRRVGAARALAGEVDVHRLAWAWARRAFRRRFVYFMYGGPRLKHTKRHLSDCEGHGWPRPPRSTGRRRRSSSARAPRARRRATAALNVDVILTHPCIFH